MVNIFNDARADGYKWSHAKQYPSNTQYVTSYIEARGCDRGWSKMVFAGMQYYLSEFLSKPLVTKESLERAKRRIPQYTTTFEADKFQYILDNYNGFAPVEIQALPEGLVVPLKTPLVQVRNTDPNCYWVTSFLETALMRIWYPCTVATLSFQIKRILKNYMLDTAGHTDGIDFMLNDFGARGVSSGESAAIGGLAHLFSFKGTDTYEAVELADLVYGEEFAGFSIDAAEHSTITGFGGPDQELAAFQHQLDVMAIPGKTFAIVSDSYDIYNAVDNLWGDQLRNQIVDLGDHGGRLVVRPDSGNPVEMSLEVVSRLFAKFGGTINQKGYKVLPSYIRVIYGDGINETSIENILENLKQNGFSAENIVFGMGGALLQQVNRDTLKFAMKACEMENPDINGGKPYPVFKDPITDPGKVSKKGRQAVTYDEFGAIVSVPESEYFKDVDTGGWKYCQNLLQPVYRNGSILRTTTLEECRRNVEWAL